MADEKIVFLGVCYKAGSNALGYDLIGVGNAFYFPFFPNSLGSLYVLVGINKLFIRSFTDGNKFRIRFKFKEVDNNDDPFVMDLTLTTGPTREFPIETTTENLHTEFVEVESLHDNFSVTTPTITGLEDRAFIGYQVCPIPCPPLRLLAPSEVAVSAEIIEPEIDLGLLGQFVCLFAQPAPISASERRAIESRPNSLKSISFSFACKTCSDSIEVYALLDPSYRVLDMDQQATYIHDAPDKWLCRCGRAPFNLTYLKRGLHSLFRRTGRLESSKLEVGFTPLYERRQIQQVARDYQALINTSPREEAVQKFIEEHPVFWSFLSPAKILHKPAILTGSKADFGILTNQGILHLVEIEKPQTPLATRAGNRSNELEKGAKQLRDWDDVVIKHFHALVSELGLSDTEVRDIRFMLIAGLSRKTQPEVLEQLHRNPLAPKTTFLCFDDLLSSLYSLNENLQGL